MTTLEDRRAYLNNPFFTKPVFGDYTAFYVTIAICTVLCVFLFALNIIIGCCTKYKYYWQDRHTGNRWLVSIWTATPHKQPPLDLTELKDASTFQPFQIEIEQPEYTVTHHKDEPRGYGRGGFHHHPAPHQPEEYVELHQRESDI